LGGREQRENERAERERWGWGESRERTKEQRGREGERAERDWDDCRESGQGRDWEDFNLIIMLLNSCCWLIQR